ncbi:MFS transporter [Streptomyces antimicrobicus]|uniref:MFS transporter n=1 Tax=Streptomyces antimicrobicus TaxID=2883108 RepID=A0ABS8B1A7_9ACTN|nr:MFS transporter [Streptomyces antimicrobicus]MCB5178387.1 MFS transporter [Streptomyces antimicrobicus]
MSAGTAQRERGADGLRAPLRRRRFRLLYAGQCLSRTGDFVFQVSLAGYAVTAGSPALLAYTLFGQATGTVLMLLVGGALADRFGARRVMLGADLARVLATAGVAVQVAAGGHEVWAVAACGLLLGLGDGAFEPAFTLAFTELLPKAELLAANALQSIALRTAGIAGAALGGALLAAVGAGGSLALGTAGFALALALVLVAGRWPVPDRPASGEGLLKEATGGIRYACANRWLWVSIASFGVSVALVVAPAKALLPLASADVLGGGAGTYSLLVGSQAAGALLGGLLVARLRRIPPGVLVFGGMTLVCGGFAVLAVSSAVVASVAVAVAVGAVLSAATVAWAATLQSRVPGELIGRVSSVDWLVSLGVSPLALVVVPQLLAYATATTVLLTAAVVALLVSAATVLVPDVRRLAWPLTAPAS